jgi:hypothetical protein
VRGRVEEEEAWSVGRVRGRAWEGFFGYLVISRSRRYFVRVEGRREGTPQSRKSCHLNACHTPFVILIPECPKPFAPLLPNLNPKVPISLATTPPLRPTPSPRPHLHRPLHPPSNPEGDCRSDAPSVRGTDFHLEQYGSTLFVFYFPHPISHSNISPLSFTFVWT